MQATLPYYVMVPRTDVNCTPNGVLLVYVNGEKHRRLTALVDYIEAQWTIANSLSAALEA